MDLNEALQAVVRAMRREMIPCHVCGVPLKHHVSREKWPELTPAERHDWQPPPETN